MGSKKREQKLMPFEKVLATLPEYEGFRAQPLYGQLQLTDGAGAAFLETLFRLLKQFSAQPAPDEASLSMLLSPLLATGDAGAGMMRYRGFGGQTSSAQYCPKELLLLVGALYYSLCNGKALVVDRGIRIRAQLLESLSQQSPERSKRFYESLLSPVRITHETIGDFGRTAPSAHTLVQHLVYALDHNLESKAARIIGRLDAAQDQLDPGEYEYFNALVYLKSTNSSDLRDAIRSLQRIAPTDPDYAPSRGMLAEALARSGDLTAFQQMFEYSSYISPCAMLVYIQQLIMNLPFSFCVSTLSPSAPRQPIHEQVASLLKRYHERYGETTLELRVVNEQTLSLRENWLDFAEDLYAFALETNGAVSAEDQELELPAAVNRAITGLSYTGDPLLLDAIFDLLEENTQAKRHKLVMYYFGIRDTGKAQVILPRQAVLQLRAARLFLPKEEYVDVFLKDIAAYEDLLGPFWQEWLTDVYFAAVTCNHEKQDLLQEKLRACVPDFDKQYGADIETQRILGLLPPPSRLMYTSAEAAFRQALESDYKWKDAGMLSLGFFRIVEVEMRRLLFMAVLPDNHPTVKAWEKALKKVDRETTEKSLRKQQLYVRSKDGSTQPIELLRLVSSLMKPRKMELGALECALALLSLQYETDAQWEPYIAELRELLYSALSDEGIAAQEGNQIARTICEQTREDFRNPPAHARYLPFSKACECRDHVNRTLQLLHNVWIKK